MTYRKDIDGLRALAVLLVLLFHCDIPGFAGGYVGVDVFFVISGFLITRIMLEDLKGGTFDFRSFYVRRARRLLPSLAVTIGLTLLAAMAIMTPEHLVETANSAIFAALSLANVHFAIADSYFGAASEIKPLLHTWSLSVEEQFYIVWPVLLVVLFRLGGMKAVLIGALAGGLVGFALSEYWIGRNPKEAYFLPMFRGYQFLAGAILVWTMDRRLAPFLEQAGLAVGAVLVIGSALAFDATTPFPGVAALVPTVGAMLMMQCGRAPSLGPTLTLGPVVWLGQVSYSVYLTHWPVIVFWRYVTVGPFEAWEMGMLLGLSIASGAALNHFVEKPFRMQGGRGQAAVSYRPMLAPLAALACLAGVALALRVADGVPQRMALVPERADYAAMSEFHFLQAYRDGTLTLGSAQSGERVLIFGDSMMQNYVPALMSLPRFAAAEVTVITRGGCVMAARSVRVLNNVSDTGCMALRDEVHDLTGPFDLVVWSQNWAGYGDTLFRADSNGRVVPAFADGAADFDGWRPSVVESLDHFAGRADRVLLIGPQLYADGVPPGLERIGPAAPLAGLEAALSGIGPEKTSNRAGLLAGLSDLAASRPWLDVVDPVDVLCVQDVCRFRDGRYSQYMDRSHHTVAATPYLADRLTMLLPAW